VFSRPGGNELSRPRAGREPDGRSRRTQVVARCRLATSRSQGAEHCVCNHARGERALGHEGRGGMASSSKEGVANARRGFGHEGLGGLVRLGSRVGPARSGRLARHRAAPGPRFCVHEREGHSKLLLENKRLHLTRHGEVVDALALPLRRSPESTRVCSAEMTSPNRSSGTRATSVGLSMQNHLDRTPSRPMFGSARQRLGSVARVLARANTPG
jgi:hypothetical protein